MLTWIFIIVGIVVIAALSIYAGILLAKVRVQSKALAENERKRMNYLHESIETIAKAMQQEQCPYSEGCIRIAVLLDNLPNAQANDFASRWPVIHEMYERIKHMPTHEARKEYPKQEIRKLDREREAYEVELEEGIQTDVVTLIAWVKEERARS